MRNLKENVKKYANKKGIPVYQLEDKIGIARGSISKWGDITPGVDKVNAIAKELGVSIDMLLAEK